MGNLCRAPFPYFGGKSKVAEVVWRAFGPDVNNYVEPFAGSLAVLLARPGGAGKIETVNDASCGIANFWRAVSLFPDETAQWCDWPVNEADLHARHAWLVRRLAEIREQLMIDPEFCDPRAAGWWVWGICQWIGGGWCAERPASRKIPRLDGIGKGVHADGPKRQLSKLGVFEGTETVGGVLAPTVERKRPTMGNTGHGVLSPTVSRRRPAMSSAGEGVHLPGLGNDRGIHGVAAAPCQEWFRALQDRMRRVRVACGDWSRVVGPSVLGKGKNVGGRRPCAVFLDPPYSDELRDADLYAEDAQGVATLAAEWALEHGDDPDLRIALCGYSGEHSMPGWTERAWRGSRGYAGAENTNRDRERIWFSPHCLPLEQQQTNLFDGVSNG